MSVNMTVAKARSSRRWVTVPVVNCSTASMYSSKPSPNEIASRPGSSASVAPGMCSAK